MKKSKAELILDKWKAELAGKDRSKPAVAGNFDELFSTWHRTKISFDDAYTLLDQAIKAHLPNDSTAKRTFQKLKKSFPMTKTLDEFTYEWRQNITSTGKQVFYSLYDIDGTTNQPPIEKMYGSMSPQEYRKQRKHADSFPTLDWESIQLEYIDEDTDLNFDDIKIDTDVDLGDL